MVDILDDEIEAANRAAEKHIAKIKARLTRLLDQMEVMGERDMGWLTEKRAKLFHEATENIRTLKESL